MTQALVKTMERGMLMDSIIKHTYQYLILQIMFPYEFYTAHKSIKTDM